MQARAEVPGQQLHRRVRRPGRAADRPDLACFDESDAHRDADAVGSPRLQAGLSHMAFGGAAVASPLRDRGSAALTQSQCDTLPLWGGSRLPSRLDAVQSCEGVSNAMAQSEIDAIRALLGAKPRPVGWAERRARIDEVGSVWPVADDVELEPADLDGVPGEWSIVPGSDAVARADVLSRRRLLLGIDREPSPPGDRGRPRRRHAHAGGRLPAGARASVPGRDRRRAHGVALSGRAGHRARPHRGRRRQRRRRADAGARPWRCAMPDRHCRAASGWLSPWTDLTMSGETLASKDAVDPLIHKPYLEELRRRLSAARHRPPRSARLAAVRRSARPAADADPGRIVRDAAGRFHPASPPPPARPTCR